MEVFDKMSMSFELISLSILDALLIESFKYLDISAGSTTKFSSIKRVRVPIIHFEQVRVK